MTISSEQRKGYQPGFQESETSRCEVTAYTHGNDPVLLDAKAEKIEFIGATEQSANYSVVQVDVSKTLGTASGTFSVDVKMPTSDGDQYASLNEILIDDDWIDIVMLRWGEPYHVMRGLIDDVRSNLIVDGSGATVKTWTISGRDFGKIWQQTPVFFNRYIGQDVGGGATLRAYSLQNGLFGNPLKTVNVFLRSFLNVLQNTGSVSWELPPYLPVSGIGDTERFFNAAWNLFGRDFSDSPKRTAFQPNMLDHSGNFLWDLAQQWSDAQFCEMFTDLINAKTGTYQENLESLPIEDSQMAVIFRDRPFPTSAGGTQSIKDSLWFRLPLYIVRQQEITARPVGRSGLERKNAFFVQSRINNETANPQIDLALPLWDVDDIQRHGIRRMDCSSNYSAKDAALANLTLAQRSRIRDWFALNPYFYNGSIVLGHGRPDIRIGTRVRIPGVSPELDETYYVEAVNHVWDYVNGLRTTLQVTRGWVGEDSSLIQAISNLEQRYKVPLPSKAGQPLAGEPISAGEELV